MKAETSADVHSTPPKEPRKGTDSPSGKSPRNGYIVSEAQDGIAMDKISVGNLYDMKDSSGRWCEGKVCDQKSFLFNIKRCGFNRKGGVFIFRWLKSTLKVKLCMFSISTGIVGMTNGFQTTALLPFIPTHTLRTERLKPDKEWRFWTRSKHGERLSLSTNLRIRYRWYY